MSDRPVESIGFPKYILSNLHFPKESKNYFNQMCIYYYYRQVRSYAFLKFSYFSIGSSFFIFATEICRYRIIKRLIRNNHKSKYILHMIVRHWVGWIIVIQGSIYSIFSLLFDHPCTLLSSAMKMRRGSHLKMLIKFRIFEKQN